jgi:hypothetical protein
MVMDGCEGEGIWQCLGVLCATFVACVFSFYCACLERAQIAM